MGKSTINDYKWRFLAGKIFQSNYCKSECFGMNDEHRSLIALWSREFHGIVADFTIEEISIFWGLR